MHEKQSVFLIDNITDGLSLHSVETGHLIRSFPTKPSILKSKDVRIGHGSFCPEGQKQVSESSGERDSIVLNTTEGRLGVVVSAVTFAQKDKSGQWGETKSNSERLLR